MSINRRQFSTLALSALAVSSMSESDAAENFPGATDCHVHIIGPQAKYPMAPNRPYTPPEASVAQLKAMHARLGIIRTVLVQPSFYGTDNSCMLDALAQLGDSARGVAVIDLKTPDATLRDMDKKGVRGVRINLESAGNRDPKAAAQMLKAFGKKVAPLNWHVQIFTVAPVIDKLVDTIIDMPVPVVIDHFGMPGGPKGIDFRGSQAVVDLAHARKAYVKLSAAYRFAKNPLSDEVKQLAQTLIYAGRDHMLWATDWPHTQTIPGHPANEVTPFSKIDDAAWLKALTTWYPDETTRKMILVDNPAKLYRF
ncbi:MAG: amidohydrolase family protein [Alphaproteobacteria bacterium]|nr:amidohydrolase family protein [Alphaproteobacteria bacterium]